MSNLIQQLLTELNGLVRGSSNPKPIETQNVDRALDSDVVWSRVMGKVREDDQWAYPWVVNVMLDDMQNYVVVTDRGRLFKADISINGADIELGEFTEVLMDFIDIDRVNTGFTVTRNAEGLKFVAVAGSAVINRNGELDSTMLFDDFEANFKSVEYPDDVPLRFCHIPGGNADFGTVRGVARSESFLIVWGDIDESTALGSVAEERFSEGGWGNSVGFMPHKYEMLPISDGVEIRMYTAGHLKEVSVLREDHAAHYFTEIIGATSEVNRMDKNALRTSLVEFLGDEQGSVADEILDGVDTRQRTVVDQQMITRESEDSTTNETDESETVETDGEAVSGTVVEIDDNTISIIADAVTARLSTALDARLQPLIDEAIGRSEVIGKITGQLDQMTAIGDRLSSLERSDQSRLIRVMNDLPTPQQEILRVGYRPSEPGKPEDSERNQNPHINQPATFSEMLAEQS